MISTFSLEKIFRLRATISRLTCSINSCTLANPHTLIHKYIHICSQFTCSHHTHTCAHICNGGKHKNRHTLLHTQTVKNTRIAHTQYTYKTKHTNTDMYTQKKKQRTNTYLRTKHTHTHMIVERNAEEILCQRDYGD